MDESNPVASPEPSKSPPPPLFPPPVDLGEWRQVNQGLGNSFLESGIKVAASAAAAVAAVSDPASCYPEEDGG